VFGSRCHRELGQRRHCVANVRTASDTCMHEFAEKRATGEALFLSESRAFSGSFGWTNSFVELRDGRRGQRPGVRRVFEGGTVPSVGLENTRDAAGTGDLDGVASLVELCAAEVSEQTKACEWRRGFRRQLQFLADKLEDLFGNFLSGTSKSKIVDLAKQADGDLVNDSMADAAIVRGRCKAKAVRCKDGVDMFLPQATGFGVTLQSMWNGEDA